MNAPRTRMSFVQEFKDDAVSLVSDQDYSCAEVARRLGVRENNVNWWVRLHRQRQGGNHSEKSTKFSLLTGFLTSSQKKSEGCARQIPGMRAGGAECGIPLKEVYRPVPSG